ncbi:Nitric-oxide reductase (EC, quinol-dependent [uncultured Gammaproteobacteria bacterium]|nr:Nitric-oxide reductase (EC, quinol-dependent [uncultured Gammaproteobacteria bacterium]
MLDIIKSSGFYLNNKYQTREAHKIILKDEMRTNTYNATTGVITISQNRALAIAETQRHYIDLYTSNKQEYQQLREDYAFPIKMILDKEKARKLSAFFFGQHGQRQLTALRMRLLIPVIGRMSH